MIKWLVKIATSPIQIIEELYPDKSQWDVNMYLVRMYYHELEKLRPGIWDRAWKVTEDAKAFQEGRGLRDQALTDVVRVAFEKALRHEMEQTYEAIKDDFEKRIAINPKLIDRNWQRITRDRIFKNNEQALQILNQEKVNGLYSWMNELNDAEHEPAFKYIVMQQLVKKYGKDKLMPPPEVDAEILAKVSELMYTGNSIRDDGNPVKFWDLWQSATLAVQSQESFTGQGWIKYPKGSNPHRLKNAIQGSGWCIATQHYAESYLERGDVYIYFDGKAQVAMHVDPGYQTYRADDDRPSGGYALEIFERYNHPVASYAAEVIEYTEANGIDIDEHTSGYEGLQQALEINQKLDTDPAYASNFRHEIYNDPGMFDYLTRERKKTREYRKAYTDAMLKQLQYASNAGSLTATIENIDNDILQENEEAFTQAAKYALKQSESWFDTFRLLHNDEAHRLVRKLMQEPEVVDKIKRLYIKRKREEQYHTTGQGDDDRSETITRWLQEDPAFYEAVKSELIGRLGQPKTVEGGNIYPRQAAFILTENNELLNKDPEIRALMEQKVLTYVSNNPDVADATKREMYHYKSRNDAFELPLEDAQYDAIVNNVDNWLWLLSPNHPRNSGKDYWTVGLSSTIEQNFSQSDERHRIDALINNSAAATSPHLILSHPNWPPYQRIPLSHIVWEIPENLRQDPRIQQRVSALITPAWQKSLNTTLQEPKEGQPFNPYDNGNRDMMKMIHRYCEMILLDGAGMTNTPEMQHTIQEHYRNPQFLYGMVRHAKTHLDATSLEDALDKMSLKNSPMPRDPEILEAVQLFRKEEAKKFIQGMYHYSFDSRAQNDAPGIDVHHLMNMQGVEPPKSQIIRDSVGSGWSNIAKDLQGDPEVQQFFTDRFGDTLRGIMEQSVPSEGNRYRRMSPLRSIDVVPEYMWQQEGFKENEKLMWVKALDRGQLINSVVYKSEDQEAWYPLAAATIWNAVPDHLKTDEDIQKAMENCLKRLITSVFQEYRVGTLEEASEAIVHAVAVHEEMMPEGSTWESPSWRSTPFRNTLKSHLDTRVINNFIAAIRVIELMYQNLSQAGYQSRYLKWLIERCQDAEQQWLWVKQDVERLHQQERDKFRLEDVFPEAGAGAPQQVQPPPQYGINPAQASSWLLRAVEAHVVKAFDQSAAA